MKSWYVYECIRSLWVLLIKNVCIDDCANVCKILCALQLPEHLTNALWFIKLAYLLFSLSSDIDYQPWAPCIWIRTTAAYVMPSRIWPVHKWLSATRSQVLCFPSSGEPDKAFLSVNANLFGSDGTVPQTCGTYVKLSRKVSTFLLLLLMYTCRDLEGTKLIFLSAAFFVRHYFIYSKMGWSWTYPTR